MVRASEARLPRLLSRWPSRAASWARAAKAGGGAPLVVSRTTAVLLGRVKARATRSWAERRRTGCERFVRAAPVKREV